MKITTKQLPEALSEVLFAGLVPYISGSPGVGKSDIVKQVAQSLNLQVIDVRLSQLDSTDLSGYPNIKNNKTVFIPPEIFPIEDDPLPKGKQGWLVFLDELSSASLPTQSAAYKLILDRMVGQHKLNPRVVIVAAGNKTTDKAIVNRMGTAMQSRLVHFDLEVVHKDWIEWANTYKFDPRITSFVEFRPDLLHNFNPNHADNTFSCPRTWEFANKLIKNKPVLTHLDIIILAGAIGEGAAREFTGFCEIFNSLPKINKIISNPKDINVDVTPDILYAFTGLIANNVNKDNAEQLKVFVERLPLEFQIITWINAIKRNKDIYSLPAIKQWIKTYAKEVIL